MSVASTTVTNTVDTGMGGQVLIGNGNAVIVFDEAQKIVPGNLT